MIFVGAHNWTANEDLLLTSRESLTGCFFDRMGRVRGLGVESENGGKP